MNIKPFKLDDSNIRLYILVMIKHLIKKNYILKNMIQENVMNIKIISLIIKKKYYRLDYILDEIFKHMPESITKIIKKL